MNDFSIPNTRNEFGFLPSKANFIRPGKRPLSSMAPVIVTNNRAGEESLYAAVGAAGGSRIISATAQVIWRVLQHGVGLSPALRESRLHDQLMPNNLLLEYSFNNQSAAALRKKGHNITFVAPGLSAVQILRLKKNGVFEAASEPRQKNSLGVVF